MIACGIAIHQLNPFSQEGNSNHLLKCRWLLFHIGETMKLKLFNFTATLFLYLLITTILGILAITLSKQITRSLTDLSVFILFVSLHQIICSLISELICLVFFAMSIALLLSFLIFPCLESILLVCFSGILLCFMLIGFILVRSKHLNLKIYLVESDTSDRTKRDN